MAEKEARKPRTVDDIVKEYSQFSHRGGKKFKDRIAAFEKFHDPDNVDALSMQHHAHYVVFGKPSDTKTLPGAYNEAYKLLDGHLKEDNDVIKDEDKLAEIMEKYADTFLQAVNKDYKGIIDHATKESRLGKKEIRELKGQLLSRYVQDGQGRGINVLDNKFIKAHKGKKKAELINILREIGQNHSKNYAGYLTGKAVGDLLDEDDRLDLVKHVEPKFVKAGYAHQDPHITRNVDMISEHYGALLQGAGEQLAKHGYKYKAPKEEKKK